MLHFLFPEGSGPDSPDEMFADQLAALSAAGFSSSFVSDAVLAGARPLTKLPGGVTVIYRGWMVKSNEYQSLVKAIERCGATAFTSRAEYLTTHHLPNWYPLLSDLTPETRIFPADIDIVKELRALDWGAYFLKDYVKSLKTARGSIIREPSEAAAVIAEMLEYRGEIEGGICVRRVEDFIPESEQRYFVLHGIAYASSADSAIPEIVSKCAARIPSKFFSVDVIRRRDGILRIVEVGDGQVSDLVGWTAESFASMWLKDKRVPGDDSCN